MSALSSLDPEIVRSLLVQHTIEETAQQLTQLFPGQRGFSVSSIRRFMQKNNIVKQQRLTQDELEAKVHEATSEVGGTYGRRMMQGYLRAGGVTASQRRIRAAQAIIAPSYVSNRRVNAQRQMNPQPYRADYFGYNMHMDQNEKLAMYGVVFVIAIDGLTAFITRAAVMPRKNNQTIYESVFAASVTDYGLWDKVIVDKGREFFLCLFIQHYLKDFRVRPDETESSRRPCYAQVTSQKNNRVERVWNEVNQRVGYPIKKAIREMEGNESFNSSNQAHLFASSILGCTVAEVMLSRCVGAWNYRSVEGMGKPVDYIPDKRNYVLPNEVLPSSADAVQLYRSTGHHLTDEWSFGVDPLLGHDDKIISRNQKFWSEIEVSYGGARGLANELAQHNYAPFQNSITRFVQLSNSLL
uniref:Integrase catalytic domain-containing protein n=1 Tax=Plectus sambesii TaxID=2011161 RepID=A0A914VHF4_9BILA